MIVVFLKKIGSDTRVHIGIGIWDCHEQPMLKPTKILISEEMSPRGHVPLSDLNIRERHLP